MRVTLLKTGQTFDELKEAQGCYERWFSQTFGQHVSDWSLVDPPRGHALPPADSVEAVVVTGSPISVYERLSWSVASGEWLAKVIEREIPVLGVCYGHQLIAEALGGEVKRSQRGREMGAIEITQTTNDPLFQGLPKVFKAWQTHIDEVVTPPPEAVVIATNDHCAIQAMAIGPRCRTVQWHPEMNREIMAYYVRARREVIDEEWGAGAAQSLEARLPETLSSGPKILANFIERYVQESPSFDHYSR
jgi:GMP synthase (glutamine-hydrolysing)